MTTAAPPPIVPPGQSRPVELSWASSGHARRLLTLALAGLVIAVTARRAEFAAAAGPALLLLATWQHDRPRTVWVSAALKAGRMIEGENGSVGVSVAGYGSHTVELRIHPAAAILPGGPGHIGPPGHGSIAGRAGSVRAGGVRAGNAKADGVEAEDSRAGAGRASVPFLAAHWGNRPVGTLEIILRDRWRLSEGRALIPLPRVDCYPLPAHQDARVVLSRLPSRLGEHAARVPGEGTEFAGVREFVPGDRQRRINWPATTRRGSLQLNTFAAERAQNVVVVADATADIGDPGSTTLDLVHRGAAATIRAYLAAHDRVGFIGYRSNVSWIAPGAGRRQFHRIMDTMLAAPGGTAWAGGMSRLPRAALPPGALIIVFSPLLDTRLVETLRDLRERGFTLLIVDVLNAAPERGTDRIAGLARRIWRMEQQAIRFSLRELGVPVVHWDGEQSLDEPLAPYARRMMVSGR